MKNKYIILLLIFNMIIIMCGCTNTSNKVDNKSEDISISEDVDISKKSSISLENSFWLNTDNNSKYYFYSENLKTNFKEKTAEEVLYEGYYTLTTNEEEVIQFKEFFDGSKDSLKKQFEEKKKEIKDGVEFGLAINTNEHKSIIHEFYGLYTKDKIIIAEVGSNDSVYILERAK